MACVDCGAPARKKRCIKCRAEYTRHELEVRRIANTIKRRLIKERGKLCGICGAEVLSITLHHIKRIADGGTNKLDNLQLACNDCHDEIHMGDRINDNER